MHLTKTSNQVSSIYNCASWSIAKSPVNWGFSGDHIFECTEEMLSISGNNCLKSESQALDLLKM
jgi:hypothetical protein